MSRQHHRRNVAAFLLFVGTFLVLIPEGARSSPRQLRLVGDKDYPPITYLESGVAKGVDVDIAKAIAERLGFDLHIDLMDWRDAQDMVLRGEADGLLSMSITDERRRLYEFTQPIRTHAFGVFVPPHALVIRDVGDLATRRVAVTRGGYPRRFMESQRVANLVLIDNYDDGFNRMAAGAVDAVAADTWVAAYTAEAHRFQDVRLVGTPFATLPAAIAVKPNNASLVADIDSAIDRITADGTLQTILDRWRPHQTMFASRQRVSTMVRWSVAALIATVLSVSAAWGHALHRQIRRRRDVQAALVEGEQRWRAERKQVDHRLQVFAHAMRCTGDCILITDPTDHLLYVNAAFISTFEYTEEEILGQRLSILASRIGGRSIDVLTGPSRGDGFQGELWTQSKSGRAFPAWWATSIVSDEHGQMIAMVGVARDESVRHNLTRQVQQSQKMESIVRMAAGVAHDFNNLLTVIMASCEETTLVPGLPDAARQGLDEMMRAARSAAGLTRQLMTLSRRKTPAQHFVNLNNLVTEMQPTIARLVQPDVQLSIRLAPDVPGVIANPMQLQQVIINLAANAGEAMPRGGRLLVETRHVPLAVAVELRNQPAPPGGYAVLAVSDTGLGMDAATLARIFEPCFTTKSGTGTGLGLATVHDIVTGRGGYIEVTSEPGAGSTFTVYLPGAGQDRRSVRRVTAKEPRGTGEIVLILQDDISVLEMTRVYLNRLGYVVIAATTRAEAYALCAGLGSPPALLITDLAMPGERGSSLADQLRRRLPMLKVLYTSSDRDWPHPDGNAMAAGSDFIAKPFNLADLAAKVHALLAGAEQGRESHDRIV
jgi:PAS domain S-box-containing protein